MELLGIDIGGTKCAVVRGNEKGEVLAKEKFETTNVNDTLAKIFDLAQKLKGNSVAVGISCGGPLDSKKGIIMSPPNLPGWDNIEIVKMVEEKLGLPAYLCNDANACALAEWHFGAGKGSTNMIFLTFGTGMGAGLILDGKLYEGSNGNAGEIGHVRMAPHGPVGFGKEGSFEGFVSGGGIAQVGKVMALEALQQGKKPLYCDHISKLDTVTAKTVAIAAKNGDETAIEVYKQTGRMLGMGLSMLVDVINPDCIVIGSIYQRDAALMQEEMEKILMQEAIPASLEAVSIRPALLGDSIGDAAALALALTCAERNDLVC